MIEFLNSNFFQTLVTLIVGTVALLVYRFQKMDRLRNAAAILLLEIQQAERAASKVRECIRRGDLNVNLHILQSDSWDQNKYLFAKFLDKDEWDSITEFYDKARLLDSAIKYAKKYFDEDVEQIRANKQRIYADIARETVTSLSLDDGTNREGIIRVMQSRMVTFDNLYMDQQPLARYNPQKNFDDAKNCIDDFGNISTTSVGQKLKKISSNKKKFLWFL